MMNGIEHNSLSSVFHMLIYIFLTFYHSNDICGIVISYPFTFLTFLPVQTKTPIQRHLFLHVFCCQYLPSPLHNRFFIVSLSSSADSPSLSNQIYPVCILISADMCSLSKVKIPTVSIFSYSLHFIFCWHRNKFQF